MAELEYAKHPFLKELGIEAENFGAYYNGKWQGSGEVLKSINPTTGEVISTTRGASPEEYECAIKAMGEARAQWASVRVIFIIDANASKGINSETNWRSI